LPFGPPAHRAYAAESQVRAQKLCYMKEKPYWCNHFGVRSYCVDTVGLDSEMIQKYIKYKGDKKKK